MRCQPSVSCGNVVTDVVNNVVTTQYQDHTKRDETMPSTALMIMIITTTTTMTITGHGAG